MFMTTTLAHYQVPIFGIGSSALETRIGADQRAVWMRPISSGAAQTEMLPAMTVRSAERVTPPLAYFQWLKMLSDYETQARRTQTRDGRPDLAEGAAAAPPRIDAPQIDAPAQDAPTAEAQASPQPEETRSAPVEAAEADAGEPAPA